jgi:hypothetical protein
MMEKTKSDPIIIEQAGMRMNIAHRQGLGGTDEGLTFDITTAGPENEGKRILRFDCFYKNPHYHIGASGEHVVHNMKDEGVKDPVRWTLEQLKTRFLRNGSNRPDRRKSPVRSTAIRSSTSRRVRAKNSSQILIGVRLSPRVGVESSVTNGSLRPDRLSMNRVHYGQRSKAC